MQIKTKRQFIDLYLAGVLGNRFPIWLDYRDAIRDKPEEVGLRELNVGAGSFEMVNYDGIEEAALRWHRLGRKFYLNASDKNHLDYLQIQGELCRTLRGLDGYLGFAKGLRMRDMFKAKLANNFQNSAVLHIMHSYMDVNTLDDIEQLWDLYPTATIEFACYSRDIGVLPNRNTIIWEVRNY